MNYILYAAVIFLASYLIGSIPWGLLIGKLYGKDVRKEGSGNIGATNVTRVVGPVQGKICFFLDFMKGFLPVLAVIILEARGFIPNHSSFRIIAMVAPVVGHMFPIFLKFKGGKGISTAAGGILALSPPACIGGLIIWAAAFLAFRYVSLASILAAIGSGTRNRIQLFQLVGTAGAGAGSAIYSRLGSHTASFEQHQKTT